MSAAPIDNRPYTMAASLLSHVADALTSLPCVLYCCVVLLCAVAVYLLAAPPLLYPPRRSGEAKMTFGSAELRLVAFALIVLPVNAWGSSSPPPPVSAFVSASHVSSLNQSSVDGHAHRRLYHCTPNRCGYCSSCPTCGGTCGTCCPPPLVVYTGLTRGSCGSDYAITTLSQCGTAAQRLNKLDTTASDDGQTSVSYDPPYCYYEGGSLKLNSYGMNYGSCTVFDECLCTKPSTLGTGVTCASNTCHYPSDGDCDDGGPNSDYSACPRGTDFTDCGYRCDMRCNPSGSLCALRDNNVCVSADQPLLSSQPPDHCAQKHDRGEASRATNGR